MFKLWIVKDFDFSAFFKNPIFTKLIPNLTIYIDIYRTQTCSSFGQFWVKIMFPCIPGEHGWTPEQTAPFAWWLGISSTRGIWNNENDYFPSYLLLFCRPANQRSEASNTSMWSVWTNQRPVSRDYDLTGPTRGQHMISLDQLGTYFWMDGPQAARK